MKNRFFFFFFIGLWAVSTAINISAQSDPKRDAPEKSEGQKKRGEGAENSTESKGAVAPTHTPEKKAAPENAGPTQTWLGVATAPLPQSLREYLEVEPGFGVQIFQVIEGSPANDAGLKPKDVLVLFGDQMLISPEHLSLLVKRLKKDDEVEMTVIRKGSEKEIKVTLGATGLRPFMRAGGPDGDRDFRSPFDSMNPQARHWEDAMRRQQDHFQKWMKDSDSHRGDASEVQVEEEPVPGKPPAISVRPGFPVKVLTAEGVIKIDNEKGELMITNKEGKHEMLLKDEEGKTVYEGKYDPEAGVESLPQEAQKHLKEMKLDDLKVLTPNAPRPKPENASQPLERASLENPRPKSLL